MESSDYIILKGSFDRDEGIKGQALSAGGSITWEADTLILKGKVSRPRVRLIIGILGLVGGLAAVIAGIMWLDDEFDIDLMHGRKGPSFVGALGIVGMIAGYNLAAWFADALLGKRVQWSIPIDRLTFDLWSKRGLNLSWQTESPNCTRFFCRRGDVEKLAGLVETMEKAAPLKDVVMLDAGPTKIMVIKEVQEITGLGLAETKDLVESCPAVIKKGLLENEAEAVMEKLRQAGATCEVK
jgi:hypothetical protein